ncbi:MAG: hypothetical protein U5R06_08610 [candidate division KSB1 bacterium]|nr:hypothetical protein [candidate division KSB1 bacterium]
MSQKTLFWGFVLLVILLVVAIVFSQIPPQIHYQGMLHDSAGEPVNDRLSVTFYLYAGVTGGAALWQESYDTLQVTNGHFSVLLGAVNPIPGSIFDGASLYLTLKVAGDQEMQPRQPLVSVGYAFKALNSDSLAGNSAADFVEKGEENSVNTLMLSDDAVTADKIGPDIVSSIDGVSHDGGNVDLVAGSNVNIVPDDAANTITISASGGQGGGDITAVTAGAGLNGGGDAGDVQLNVNVPLHLSSDQDTVILGSCGSGFGYLGSLLYGVYGETIGDLDTWGVLGKNAVDGNWGGLGGDDVGIRGYSPHGRGIYGSSDSNTGVYGKNTVNGFYGYLGGSEYAVYGENAGKNTYAYLGGDSVSVYGSAGSPMSSPHYAVLGEKGSCWGALASSYHMDEEYGVVGFSQMDHGVYGIGGLESAGVFGQNSGHYGYLGGDYGVYGEAGVENMPGHGKFGFLGGNTAAVYGENPNNGNYAFLAGDTSAVFGYTEWSNFAVFGENPRLHCWGALAGTHPGYSAQPDNGVFGYSFEGVGVWGESETDIGVYGDGEVGVKAQGSYRAGWFVGDVDISGALSKGGGAFKIDHPLDPENKYLQHSFVESPDMMNVYNGNVELDAGGRAVVELPDWFEVLNRDFRYQLTAIGEPGPNLHISEEVQDNRFVIAGGTPGMTVSWQITGIRQDPWAKQHRIQVEVNKQGEESGRYLYPEENSVSETQGIHYQMNQK